MNEAESVELINVEGTIQMPRRVLPAPILSALPTVQALEAATTSLHLLTWSPRHGSHASRRGFWVGIDVHSIGSQNCTWTLRDCHLTVGYVADEATLELLLARLDAADISAPFQIRCNRTVWPSRPRDSFMLDVLHCSDIEYSLRDVLAWAWYEAGIEEPCKSKWHLSLLCDAVTSNSEVTYGSLTHKVQLDVSGDVLDGP